MPKSTPKQPQHRHLCGITFDSLLSAPLFMAEYARSGTAVSLSRIFHSLWTDFADALAACPEPAEIALVLRGRGSNAPGPGDGCHFCILVIGRGTTAAEAERSCESSLAAVRGLADTILGFARFREMDAGELADVEGAVFGPSAIEVRRRRESFGAPDQPGTSRVGFLFPQENHQPAAPDLVTHLFPWVPSDDPWARLAHMIAREPAPAALVVHAQGFRMAPEEAVAKACGEIRQVEDTAKLLIGGMSQPFLHAQLESLKILGTQRLAALYHRVLAIRVFITGALPPSPALLATLAGSIDDPSASHGVIHSENPFRSGFQLRTVSDLGRVLAPLLPVDSDELFSPSEATAVLRSPMPTDDGIAGIPLLEARTLPQAGSCSGTDVTLGVNVHGASRVEVRLTEELRFRHTYVIGQTGTGKSTLLLNMVLGDAALGRGICLVDPHGSLIDDTIRHLPPERHQDVIVLDLVDYLNPVGFNPLCILQDDPDRYVLERDLIIDGLLAYLLRSYQGVPEAFGPVFENHFRTMMALLLGVSRPSDVMVPNLLLFRRLYGNARMRNELIHRSRHAEPALKDALDEAMRANDEASWDNIAPYITSKFARFVGDTTLRNIICQGTTLDFASMVREKKILLVHLGRGRIGDFPAGLLAGQILAGIHRAVMARGTDPAHPPFYFYADEFQIFADSRFAELLAEARKFRLSLTLAHQHLEQLPPDVRAAVLGNCGTVITFRVGANDAANLAPLFSPYLMGQELVCLPNYTAYVRSSGALGIRPFSVSTLPPPPSPAADHSQAVREASRNRFGRTKLEVEREMSETLAAYDRLGVSQN
jgi:hypothetical protein